MSSLTIFLKTYWQHARSVLDLIIFIASLIVLFSGAQIVFAIEVGIALLVFVAILAMYKTWLYQYRLTQKLIDSQDKAVGFDDLNDIQKSILHGMSTESEKRIITVGTNGGPVFLGVGDAGDKHENAEVEAELPELEKLGILRVGGYSQKSGNPIYKPTGHGFKLIKELQENK